MILGVYNRAGAVTFSGLVLSLSACILSFNDRFELAVVCFVLAGLCDLFDGVVARKTNTTAREKEFGFHLDSLVDIVSFGVTPGIILLHSGFNGAIDHVLIAFFGCSAAMRLAFFNTTKKEQGADLRTFTGLPVTYSALILPLAFTVGTFMEPAAYILLVRVTLFVVGLLYLLNIPVPKPRGIFYALFPAVAAGLSLFWLSRAIR